MKPNTYVQRAVTTSVEHPDKLTRAVNAVFGLSSEVGELASEWRDHLFRDGHQEVTELLRFRTKDELGDVCWYVALMCDALDLDLNDVLQANLTKLRERHPDGYAGRSCQVLPAETVERAQHLRQQRKK